MGVSAILLAAGESRRMGERNKLELLVDGVPLVRRTAQTILASGLDEVVVVLGHEADRVEALLSGLDLRCVRNEAYADGQMSSVHLGLASLERPCSGVMICLADQPLIEADDLDRLVERFLAGIPGSVLVPTHEGRRGNPIVLAWHHREEILAGGRNLGCRRLVEKNPHLVSTMEMETDHVVFDLDTPGDYDSLHDRLAGRREPRAAAEARR